MHTLGPTNVSWICTHQIEQGYALTDNRYWGWWELGRPMSFSPIEIAKVCRPSIMWITIANSVAEAFDSPLLDQCNSNSSGREIAKVQSDTRLRYGVTKSTDKTTVLAFARPELVDRPVKDAKFDS